MVDIEARKKAAEIARHFASGQITNFEFENELPNSNDPAIWAIEDTFWALYDDFIEHKINGHWEVPKEIKKMMARCVMFLYSNEEYKWPKISQPGLRPFQYGFFGKLFKRHLAQEHFLSVGEYSVWPFVNTESYNTARNNPYLLNNQHSD